MNDILSNIFSKFTGTPEVIAMLLLVSVILWFFGHYLMEFVKFLWKEVYPKIKKESNDSKKELIDSKNKENIEKIFHKIYESHLKEKIIYLIKENTNDLRDFNKIFKDNYEDNVENVINDINEKRNNEIMKRIFELYEKITNLREIYAGKMATREDLQKINDTIRSIERDIEFLKQKIMGIK